MYILLQGGVNICDKRLVIPLHALAVLAVIGGIYRAATTGDATLKTMLMGKYLLWAILFEIGALNASLSGK